MEGQLDAVAKIIEQQIDDEIDKLDRLEVSDLESIRRKRIEEMKKRADKKKEWAKLGHGNYTEITDEKEFFEITKQSEAVCCHFYKDDTFRCKIVDKHLSELAPKHIECRFLKFNVMKAPFLTTRLGIRVIPTIVCVKDGKTKDFIVGFEDLGNCDDFSNEMMEWRLGVSDVIEYKGDLLNPPTKDGSKSKQTVIPKGKGKTIKCGRFNDSDSEDSD